MSCVRPIREILPRLSKHTPANAQLYDAVMVLVSQELGRKCRTRTVFNPGPVVCESDKLYSIPIYQNSYLRFLELGIIDLCILTFCHIWST